MWAFQLFDGRYYIPIICGRVTPCRDDALKLWPVNLQKIGNVRNKDRDVLLPETET